MTRILTLALAALSATPALAASGPFFSLHNTNFVVLLAFILFVAILIYFKVPGIILGLLDKRAVSIQAELDEARTLREEAQTLLASYKRKQEDMTAQAERIVDTARKEAVAAGEKAKLDIQDSVARRLASAEEQIASAEASAIRDVRDQAVSVAVAVADEVIAAQMGPDQANALFDASVNEVQNKLH